MLLLEILQHLDLYELARRFLPLGQVDEGDPLRRDAIIIEMLMFNATGFDRQENEVALFPVMAFAVTDRPARTFQDENDEAALVPVFSALLPDV